MIGTDKNKRRLKESSENSVKEGEGKKPEVTEGAKEK